MDQRYAEIELRKIEKIAKEIFKQKTSQTCGTEYQKWTYALLKAREIHHDTNR
tara:strand:+ start:330 stop:488 length:159 start_codon:yes stop_codon:yes gene_type:complete